MSISDFADMLTDTVRVSARASRDQYGVVTWSTQTSTYSARIVIKPGLVKQDDGSERVSRGMAWVASTGRLSPLSRITIVSTGIVDQLGTSTPPVLAVETYPDDSGVHHNKVLFG